MTIYKYIASSDPYGAQAIINKYGYSFENVNTSDDLAEVLQSVFTAEGLPVLKDIVEIHPDKELIEEYYSQSRAMSEMAPAQSGGCGCKSCKEKKSSDSSVSESYLAAAGGKVAGDTGYLLHQGNTFLILAGILALTAIIVSSNKNS